MNNDIDNPNSEYWKQKYLKYKSKYMNLNNTTGGRHSRRYNSPSRHSYRNPYYRPQYPTLPQMPFIVTNSDSNLTIGNDNSDVSIVMPLSPLGQFGPVVKGNTMLGPYGQFMTVLSPKSKAATTTTSTTTPSTSFTDDPIYKAHGTIINENSNIYFKIKNGTQFLVNGDTTVIKKSLNNSSPYSEQIKEYLDQFLVSSPSLKEIKNKHNFMVVDRHFVFKFTTTFNKKGTLKFEDAINIKEKEKIEL
jgi:hypothetical protein